MDACTLLAELVKVLKKSSQINGQPPCGGNPVTISTDPQNPTKLLDINIDRVKLSITNISSSTIYIVFGNPNPNSYQYPLQACAIAGDGSGDVLDDEIWQGSVYAFSAGNGSTPKVNLSEYI